MTTAAAWHEAAVAALAVPAQLKVEISWQSTLRGQVYALDCTVRICFGKCVRYSNHLVFHKRRNL